MKAPYPELHSESQIVGVPLPELIQAPFSEQYGSRWQAARYCGLSSPPSSLPGEWQHGWLPEYANWHPEGIVGTDGTSRYRKTESSQFVARQDQAEALTRFGYTKAFAIGHPLAYVDAPRVDRLPNSLLVMPVHSISTTEHQWNFDEYAECIEGISADFDQIVICVSPSCFQKGYWVEAFRRRGFPVISGANFLDKNAYVRMATLFQRFEFTTTNGFGSHLAYAQFYGSRTTIYGPWPDYRPKDFEKDPFYLRCPEILEFYFATPHRERVRGSWPWLFRDPREGIAAREWAEGQLGKDQKRGAQELMELFGWSQQPADCSLINVVRSTAKEGLLKASRAFYRLAEPAHAREERSLAKLMAGTKNGIATSVLNDKIYKITNGPRAVREFEVFHQKRIGSLFAEPPEAPFFDLVPGDGIAFVACRTYHSYRKFYFLSNDDGSCIQRNIRSFGLDNVTSIGVPKSISAKKSFSCCDVVHWLEHYGDDGIQRNIIESSAVIRLRLCPDCQERFFANCKSLPGLSLLLIEYIERNEPSLSPIMDSLSRMGFTVNTRSLHFYPAWNNPDCEANLTYLAALRLGEAQRSQFARSQPEDSSHLAESPPPEPDP